MLTVAYGDAALANRQIIVRDGILRNSYRNRSISTKNSITITLLRSCWTLSAMTQICSGGFLLVMQNGFVIMTWKPKLNNPSGSCAKFASIAEAS